MDPSRKYFNFMTLNVLDILASILVIKILPLLSFVGSFTNRVERAFSEGAEGGNLGVNGAYRGPGHLSPRGERWREVGLVPKVAETGGKFLQRYVMFYHIKSTIEEVETRNES